MYVYVVFGNRNGFVESFPNSYYYCTATLIPIPLGAAESLITFQSFCAAATFIIIVDDEMGKMEFFSMQPKTLSIVSPFG
jgi:hypothetical protein